MWRLHATHTQDGARVAISQAPSVLRDRAERENGDNSRAIHRPSTTSASSADVTRARFAGGAYAKLARAHGYADGYMRALLDAGYQGFVGHEFIPRGPDPVAALRQGVLACDV